MKNLYEQIEQKFLPFVEKPLRYTGSEKNIVIKDHKDKFKVLLAFPEVYEIGMPYGGFAILYNILNSHKDIVCERVYTPAIDAGNVLRDKKLPLFSLETRTDIKDFDLIGFTLPYELNYTNILEILDLGNIPLRSKDRTNTYPLIIGGGVNAINPEPIADFFDFFQIGDGEEKIIEIVNLLIKLKKENLAKNEILNNLTSIKSVYVPTFFVPKYDEDNNFVENTSLKENYKFVTKAISNLKLSNFPHKPLVPITSVAHDRVSVEIMRGCSRGCRFCQAGFYYRPIRERSVDDILIQSEKALESTGFNELTLLSLSTSDYTNINKLLSKLYAKYVDKHIRISFPSIRAESFTEEIAEISRLNSNSGNFTFAPEVGSERMRKIVNKDVNLGTILNVLGIILPKGWKNIKLYFMIGLPFEEDHDLIEMSDMINAIADYTKKFRGVNLNVSISPFNPKPHTPFQWAKQPSVEEFNHKIYILRQRVKRKSIRFNWREPEVSSLEAIFSRGDRRLCAVLETAFRKGTKFNGWSEHVDYDLWMKTFEELGIDYRKYLDFRDENANLPWENILTGVSKQYLLDEWNKSKALSYTKDCREGCNVCGIEQDYDCDKLLQKQSLPPKDALENILKAIGNDKADKFDTKTNKPLPQTHGDLRYRVKFKRLLQSRFLSQRDLLRYIERAIIQDKIAIDYSKGYHPTPLMSFSHPLSFGFSSNCEYIDLTLKNNYSGDIKTDMEKLFSHILSYVDHKKIAKNERPLMAFINYYEYSIKVEDKYYSILKNKIQQFDALDFFIIERRNKKGKVIQFDLKKYIRKIEFNDDFVKLGIQIIDERTIKTIEIFKNLFEISEHEYYTLSIKKIKAGKITEKYIELPI